MKELNIRIFSLMSHKESGKSVNFTQICCNEWALAFNPVSFTFWLFFFFNQLKFLAQKSLHDNHTECLSSQTKNQNFKSSSEIVFKTVRIYIASIYYLF